MGISSSKPIGTLWALVLAAALLLAPAASEAKFPPADAEEPQAGISVTGIGLARVGHQPTAVTRAVRDARQRAVAVGRVTGAIVGEIEHVELRDVSQFGRPDPCRAEGRRGARGGAAERCARLTAAAASVTFAIVGGGDGEGDRTLGAGGNGRVAVAPADPDRNPSIRRSMLAARRTATPRAALVARRNARAAARAAGLSLGALVSIAEAPAPYYMPTFYEPALGTFGPGRFCGIVRRPVFQRDPETGLTEVVRRVPQRRCSFVRPYDVRLEIRYEAR